MKLKILMCELNIYHQVQDGRSSMNVIFRRAEYAGKIETSRSYGRERERMNCKLTTAELIITWREPHGTFCETNARNTTRQRLDLHRLTTLLTTNRLLLFFLIIFFKIPHIRFHRDRIRTLNEHVNTRVTDKSTVEGRMQTRKCSPTEVVRYVWVNERERTGRRRSDYCAAAATEAAAPEHLNRDRLASLATTQIPWLPQYYIEPAEHETAKRTSIDAHWSDAKDNLLPTMLNFEFWYRTSLYHRLIGNTR